MFFILIALFVAGPIAEIYVLITAGSLFGVGPVIATCIATALIGGWIIRLQGLKALYKIQQDLNSGTPPLEPVFDGVLVILAAPFLMTPGFLTDILGFLLLTPPIRRFIGRYLLVMLKARMDDNAKIITIDRP